MSARPTVADWLELHDIGAAALADWLEAAGPPPAAWFRAEAGRGAETARAPAGGDAAWALCLEALRLYLGPELSERVTAAGARTACLSRPPPGDARAATLPHPGTGAPVVLCPYDASPEMLVVLAHECGHAIHMELAPRMPLPPPILRETCACLAEYALAAHLRDLGAGALFAACAGSWDRALARAAGQGRTRLRDALADPAAASDYRHNYAPARLLAARLTAPGTSAARAGLFLGTHGLGALTGGGATTV